MKSKAKKSKVAAGRPHVPLEYILKIFRQWAFFREPSFAKKGSSVSTYPCNLVPNFPVSQFPSPLAPNTFINTNKPIKNIYRQLIIPRSYGGRIYPMELYLEAGKIINTHGVRGEVKIEHWCDSPDVLAELSTVYFKKKGGFVPIKIKSPACSLM